MKQIETEVKYVIEKPSVVMLSEMSGYSESEIEQIYIEDSSLTHRVRSRRFSDGKVEYTENTKKRISQLSSIECEREISESEYALLSKEIEPGTSPLYKTRRSFEYHGKVFELDFYPNWQRSCIMEIELDSEGESIDLPPFIKVILDVTGKKEYSNHSMAYSFPKEII